MVGHIRRDWPGYLWLDPSQETLEGVSGISRQGLTESANYRSYSKQSGHSPVCAYLSYHVCRRGAAGGGPGVALDPGAADRSGRVFLSADGGRGADLVFDTVSGARLEAHVAALARRGRLVLIGLMAGADRVDEDGAAGPRDFAAGGRYFLWNLRRDGWQTDRCG